MNRADDVDGRRGEERRGPACGMRCTIIRPEKTGACQSIGQPEQQSRVLNEVLHALLVRAGTLKGKKKAVPGCLPHNKVRTVLLFASAKPACSLELMTCLVQVAKVQSVSYRMLIVVDYRFLDTN
jgi:hypothetical protein